MTLTIIWNKIKTYILKKKNFCIIPFTKKNYIFLLLLKKYFFNNIFKINSLIIIQLKSLENIKSIDLIFLNNNKNNIFKYNNLKMLTKKYINGIVSTPKGFLLISEAISLKQGGNLICLIYNKSF